MCIAVCNSLLHSLQKPLIFCFLACAAAPFSENSNAAQSLSQLTQTSLFLALRIPRDHKDKAPGGTGYRTRNHLQNALHSRRL